MSSRASNNSPRGIWSDSEVMYVADESDDKVYSYNMPDAIDARLASLTLSGVDIGVFDPGTVDYEGTPGDGVTETTVTAEALQPRADIDIDPPDADPDTDGHQVSLDGTDITVTVMSPDGSRTRVYRVALEAPPRRARPHPRLDRHRLARRRRRRHRRCTTGRWHLGQRARHLRVG